MKTYFRDCDLKLVPEKLTAGLVESDYLKLHQRYQLWTLATCKDRENRYLINWATQCLNAEIKGEEVVHDKTINIVTAREEYIFQSKIDFGHHERMLEGIDKRVLELKSTIDQPINRILTSQREELDQLLSMRHGYVESRDLHKLYFDLSEIVFGDKKHSDVNYDLTFLPEFLVEQILVSLFKDHKSKANSN